MDKRACKKPESLVWAFLLFKKKIKVWVRVMQTAHNSIFGIPNYSINIFFIKTFKTYIFISSYYIVWFSQ